MPTDRLQATENCAEVPFSLAPPEWLLESYERLVLISRREQIGLLDPGDHRSLIATTDWLTWRILAERGAHVVIAEGLMKEWPEWRGEMEGFHQRHGAWMYDQGRDMTLFHGVSIGKQLNNHAVLARHLIEKLWDALDRLCVKYRPREIVLYDVRTEYDYIGDEEKRILVGEMAARHGAVIVDRLASRSSGGDQFATSTRAPNLKPENRWRDAASELYATGVDILTRLRAFFGSSRPTVFLLLNWIAMRNMVDHFAGQGVTPVLLARQWPKRPSFIVKCLRKGIALTSLPKARFSREDRRRLEEIAAGISSWSKNADTPVEKIFRRYIRSTLLDQDTLRERAIEILRYAKLFSRFGLSAVVLGESCNMICRTLADLAGLKKARVEEMLNGMFLSRQRMDTRCGDAHQEPVVTRVLTWGEPQERWLESIGSPVGRERVGYPALDHLLARNAPSSEGESPAAFRRALILPLTVDIHDVMARNNDCFDYLIPLIHGLKAMGIGEIRVKTHPGVTNGAYYKAVLDHYGLDCPVYRQGDLIEHVDWADMVIGPVNSGSLVEVSARGKPYYVLRNRPSALDDRLFGAARTYQDVKLLLDDIKAGHVPDSRAIADSFCSTGTIPVASVKAWEAIIEGLRNRAA